MALGPDKAPRYLQTLTHDQMSWAEAQDGGRSRTVRRLVDAAMAGALEPAEAQARRVLIETLRLLDKRGSWLRGSPGELLRDLEVGETTALELVDEVCGRLRQALHEGSAQGQDGV